MKLESHSSIAKLEFHIEDRKLTVFHNESDQDILNSLSELQLDSKLISTELAGDDVVSDNRQQSSLLRQVLLINFSFFVIEMVFGLFSNSMGLVSDSWICFRILLSMD